MNSDQPQYTLKSKSSILFAWPRFWNPVLNLLILCFLPNLSTISPDILYISSFGCLSLFLFRCLCLNIRLFAKSIESTKLIASIVSRPKSILARVSIDHRVYRRVCYHVNSRYFISGRMLDAGTGSIKKQRSSVGVHLHA